MIILSATGTTLEQIKSMVGEHVLKKEKEHCGKGGVTKKVPLTLPPSYAGL